MFRKTAFASVAVLLLSTVAGFSAENSDKDDSVHDRPVSLIKSNLAEYHGVIADRVETWGEHIVVHTHDENNASRVLFIDKVTLQPIAYTPDVATQLEVVAEQPVPVSRRGANEPALSLSDIYSESSSTESAV